MSVEYNGTHSIDFWNLDETMHICQNSWKNLHMIPAERPYVATSQPSEVMDHPPTINGRVYIPGFVSGTLTYDIKQGEWEFYVDHDQWGGSINCYKKLIEYLHGTKMAIRLNGTDGLIYKGRLQVNNFEPDSSYSKVTIGYNLGYSPVDAADLNLKVIVNWYDYDGTLIYSGLEDIGSTPTVPNIPSTDGTGTDPNASWDDGGSGGSGGSASDPVSGNTDHHVATGTLIVYYGHYKVEEKKYRAGDTFEINPTWLEKGYLDASYTPSTGDDTGEGSGTDTPSTGDDTGEGTGTDTPTTGDDTGEETGTDTPATGDDTGEGTGTDTPSTGDDTGEGTGTDTPATGDDTGEGSGTDTPATGDDTGEGSGTDTPATGDDTGEETGTDTPTTQSSIIDTKYVEWYLGYPTALSKDENPKVEGIVQKGSTTITIPYSDALVYSTTSDGNRSLTIYNIDAYTMDDEEHVLYIH